MATDKWMWLQKANRRLPLPPSLGYTSSMSCHVAGPMCHIFFRLMKYVLKGRQWKSLLLYLDDILVFSKTNEEHVGRLREVLQ